MQAKSAATLTLLLLMSAVSPGVPKLTLSGKVVDSAGRPLRDATVMIYHAGVLNGYSTFCPSCYKDCGKRTRTDASGGYRISQLESGLWFDLLVVHSGYAPEIVKVKDVSAATAPVATLKVRSSPADPNRMVEGHVVDANGSAVPDALVTTVGVEIEHGSSLIGTIRGLDPLAVTDQSGNFEIFYEKPAEKMLVTIEARTLAMKFATLVTGPERQTIELSNGATVKGRLVQDGKPVGDAEIGLIGKERGGFGAGLEIVGDMYPEMRVGTQQDGTFAISDVPTGVQWLVYAKMESVASRGASKPKACITTRPNEIVDVGDIQLHQGHRLQGKVVLSDGKSVPDGMRFILGSRIVWDTQIASLDRDGRFEFLNLPDGDYSIGPAVRGYSLPGSQDDLQISVQRDIDNLVVTLDPQKKTGVKE